MAQFVFPPVSVSFSSAGLATAANQVLEIAQLTDVNTELNSQTALLTSSDASLSSIDTKVSTSALQTSQLTELQSINTELDTQTGTLSQIDGYLQSIDSNVATETTLNVVFAEVASINSKVATEAKQDLIIAELQSINTASSLSPVDFLDSGLLNSASTNITTSGVSVVASLAANVREIEIVDDIGEFMALTNGADTILAYLPLGGGRVKITINSGTALKLRSLTGSTITTGSIAMNFLG